MIAISPEQVEKNYSLTNLSHLTIYFNDNPSKQYNILFRNGNAIYLNEPIDRDIPDGTELTILYKKNIPVLSAVATKGSSFIKLQTYPRFSKGATIMRKDMITFTDDTLSMYRTTNPVDYLSSVMDIAFLTKVKKVYKNANEIFVENIDYNLINSGNIIEWTNVGRTKILANTKYYVDITRKIIKVTTSDTIHFVKNINGKYVEISPVLPEKLSENEVFDYVSDTFNLLPYEIADVGDISINII